jgi:hypothetical protein
MQKYKRVPLPHWLVPIRTQIQKRPLTSILALAGQLLIAILVIQYEQGSPVGVVVSNQVSTVTRHTQDPPKDGVVWRTKQALKES